MVSGIIARLGSAAREQPVGVMIQRVVWILFWLSVVTAFGTLGFHIIEGWSWIDSLYMAVITLSTVGFGEVAPLSSAGRLFTVALIALGVGTALYLVAVLAELVAGGKIREALHREFAMRRIERKQGHVIVAGFGRFGRAVVDELLRAGRQVVIIDPDSNLKDELEERDLTYLIASGSSDDALSNAGIKGASAIVAATASEAENVFIALGARELNPEIYIHARCESVSGGRRLRRAGADHLTAPFQMGGARAAASILRPAVVDFLELVSPRRGPKIDLEEIQVASGSTLDGTTVGELEKQEVRFRIVAVKHPEDDIVIVPGADTPVAANDVLVAIGERESLMALAHSAERGPAAP